MIAGYEQIELNTEQVPDSEQVLVSKIYKSLENILVLKKVSDLSELENTWEEVQQFVAGNIQSNLETIGINDNFAWNIYIIYLVTFSVPYKLGNEIESNKFCCKKYIVLVDDLAEQEQIKAAIEHQLPLFAQFEIGDIEPAASSDNAIKNTIFQKSNQSPLARKFLSTPNIDQVVDSEAIDSFITAIMDEEK